MPYQVGTMIEVPRGALTAGDIAKTAEFFSFGTNDLTQTTYGLSRDDTGPVMATYLEKEIWPGDPFVSIDREGVGALMRMAVQAGARHPPEAPARHLRRARRRSRLGRLLPRDRPRLRLLLALPDPHRPAGGGAGGAAGARRARPAAARRPKAKRAARRATARRAARGQGEAAPSGRAAARAAERRGGRRGECGPMWQTGF